MKQIAEINTQYVKLKHYKSILLKCYSEIERIKNDRLISSDHKIELLQHAMINAYQNNADLVSDYFNDVISLTVYFIKYVEVANQYQQTLLRPNYSKMHETNNVFSEVKTCGVRLKTYQNTFFQKYSKTIQSKDNLVDLISECVDLEKRIVETKIEGIKNEAIKYLEGEYPVSISSLESYNQSKVLPQRIYIGNYFTGDTVNELLFDIGYHNNYQRVYNDLRNHGNILINTSTDYINDEAIDNFVIAYIFRYISSFPLGTVNVHIFDNNANYLYKRLENSFKSDKSNDSSQKVITIHSTFNDLKTLCDNVCDDIFKKTSSGSPDLYSIFEKDSSDAFNLIIIRNGLGGTLGSSGSTVLNTLSRNTKANDIGHICGFRFVMVDDSDFYEKSITKSTLSAINKVKGNFTLKLQFDGKGFVYNKNTFDALCINDNTDRFIQERGALLSSAISKKEQGYIRIEETQTNEIERFNESILYIPIGKSGNDIVEIPLSCRDDNSSLEGQCIGYMAIGRSGSGKSSLFHSIVLNGCLKYSPEDLQFWLLDFKFGGASSKYNRSGLPHIRIVAENNKIDDALCLFQMIRNEMEQRNACFNKHNVDNIVDYNRLAESDDLLEHFPRIIVMIDEIQEIFRDENAAKIKDLISSISVRMRSSGIHFVMIAQNLVDGKAYMLKESFLPHASGRICFRVEEKIPFESGFGNTFAQRKAEIAALKTGEAYLSYGNNHIKKVKISYASPQEMNDDYFVKIREKYRDYAELKPVVIGSKKRLKIQDHLQNSPKSYFEEFKTVNSVNGIYSALIGEDAYRMAPFMIKFSQNTNSSVLFLGNDKAIASSLCTSIALSLIKQDVKIHLFNGDKSKIQSGDDIYPHAFMYLCGKTGNEESIVTYHKSSELSSVLKDIYSRYLERENLAQQFEDEDNKFDAEFIIINDPTGIKAIVDDVSVSNSDTGNTTDDLLKRRMMVSNSNNVCANFNTSTQKIIDTLMKDGYRYNIHIIMAVKEDISEFRSFRSVASVKNIFMFNAFDGRPVLGDAYFIREMLKNISDENGHETMAVYSQNGKLSKIRPVIYNLNNSVETGMIDELIAGD